MEGWYDMAVWMVGYFSDHFYRSQKTLCRFFTSFYACFFSFENLVKGSITKMRTIGETSRSALGLFKTIKHDTRDNPSAVNCTSNAQK